MDLIIRPLFLCAALFIGSYLIVHSLSFSADQQIVTIFILFLTGVLWVCSQPVSRVALLFICLFITLSFWKVFIVGHI